MIISLLIHHKYVISNHVSVLENHQNNHNIFMFKMVSSNYVHTVISRLNEDKATGLDNIHRKGVKMCGNELSITLT